MDESAYVALTGHELFPARDNWKTLCPLHSEGTPSFFIHKETYLSHCFGCDARGYLDNLLSQAYEIPARELRSRLGITAESRLEASKFKKTADAIETAFERAWLAGFPRILTHPYLESRGLAETTIVEAGARWDDKERRIVFPLWNLGFQIDGATGRTLVEGEKKWHFYWTTNKGSILYGLEKPVQHAYVVEGVFDVLWMWQLGYTNTVAILGSHPTKTQIVNLKWHYDSVTLMLDNDAAGQGGQDQLAQALRSDMEVSCVEYPGSKKDPFELSEDEVHEAIANRLTYVEYINSRC